MGYKFNKDDVVYGFKIICIYKQKNDNGRFVNRVVLKCQDCGTTLVRGSSCDKALQHIKCDCKNKSKQIKHRQKIEWEGQLYTQKEFCELHNINHSALRSRVKSGMSLEDAVKSEWTRNCIICGKEFTTTVKSRQTCGKVCARRLAHGKGAYRKEKVFKCVMCGNEFLSIYDNAKTCSDLCRRQRTTQLRNRRYKHLQKMGKFDESVTLEKVFEKYNGICQICGMELTFDTSVTGDDYPSIDHIKPLSKGGTHEWDNVQLLCRKCNYTKKDN